MTFTEKRKKAELISREKFNKLMESWIQYKNEHEHEKHVSIEKFNKLMESLIQYQDEHKHEKLNLSKEKLEFLREDLFKR